MLTKIGRDREDVDRWLEDYVEAWRPTTATGSRAFSRGMSYRYHPADEPIEGRDAVVESWLGEGDHPDASAA